MLDNKEQIVKLYSKVIEVAGTQINNMSIDATAEDIKETDRVLRDIIKEIEKAVK